MLQRRTRNIIHKLCGFVVCTAVRAYQIDITGANAQSYQSIQNSENQFKYGYQVRNVNDQFQHKLKSADNVTYGCYGYTHPAGEDSSDRGDNGMKFAATYLRPIVDSFGRGRSGLEFASTDLRPIAVPYDHEQSDIQSAGSEPRRTYGL
uniref:Uncharacterized protein n=1 Tax=Anopheles merus TaxID=30066 RepID=A0A182UPD8_ANOME